MIGQFIDVPAIAQLTLDGIVAHFAAAGVELPERRVIVAGEPRAIAWDCPSLTIASGGILWGAGPGTGSATARRTGNPVSVGARYTVITAQIIRCAPGSDGGEPPDPDVLTEAGLTTLKDGGLLSQALVEMCGRNGVFRQFGTGLAGGVDFLGPDGGFVACEGNLTVTAANITS